MMDQVNEATNDESGTLPLWHLLNNLNTLHEFLLLNGFLSEQLPFICSHLQATSPQHAAKLNELLARMNYDHKQYQFSYLQVEIVITRTVDGFHSYLVDMLRAYFRVHPDAIDAKVKRGKPRKVSGRGTPVDSDVEFYALQAADKLVHDGGLEEIVAYLRTKLGVEIRLSDEQMRMGILTIATRNIIGHNRGRITEQFLRRTGQAARDDQLLDLPLITSFDEAMEYMQNLVRIATTIDRALTAKFGRTMFAQFYPFPTLTEGVHITLR